MEIQKLLFFCLSFAFVGGISGRFQYHGVDDDHEMVQERLRERIQCNNKQLRRRVYQKGKFWAFQNYVAADHGNIDCYSSITLTTITDVRYLDNLIALIRRWKAPISLTIYAPGEDLQHAVDSIKYLRTCLEDPEDSRLIRYFVSFHLYFNADHIVDDIKSQNEESTNFCQSNPMQMTSYRSDHHLEFFINVARNIALDAVITHFVFPVDIELYPSEHAVTKFMRFIAFDESNLDENLVFVVPPFEVTAESMVPNTKQELIHLLHNHTAIEFHSNVCLTCARVPEIERWKIYADSEDLRILTTTKRIGMFGHWEPFFISARPFPYFEERCTHRRKSDRLTQMTAMCLQDYDFAVLDNIFLVHHPGIKKPALKNDLERKFDQNNRESIQRNWVPEYLSLYGPRAGCHL